MIHKLPDRAIQSAQQTISSLYLDNNRQSLGFILPSINNNELSYFFIRHVNEYLKNNFNTEICFYTLTQQVPILTPYTSIYNIFGLSGHYDPIIATDPSCLTKINLSKSNQKYYYIYDPLLLKISKFLDKIDTSDIIMLVRNKDHEQFVKKEFGIKPHHKYVPNCEIDIFMEIIYGK